MRFYTINLEHAHARRVSVIAEFGKQQIPVKLVYGVNNNLLKLIKPGVRLSCGGVGAFVSHTMVMANAMLDNSDTFVITEDDVRLPGNFRTVLNDYMQTLPLDWDIAFIGWFTQNSGGPMPSAPQDKWIQVNKALGMHAYVVRKQSIPRLLSVLNNVEDHIDKQICRAIEQGRLKGYWSKEKLVTTKGFPTQIAK